MLLYMCWENQQNNSIQNYLDKIDKMSINLVKQHWTGGGGGLSFCLSLSRPRILSLIVYSSFKSSFSELTNLTWQEPCLTLKNSLCSQKGLLHQGVYAILIQLFLCHHVRCTWLNVPASHDQPLMFINYIRSVSRNTRRLPIALIQYQKRQKVVKIYIYSAIYDIIARILFSLRNKMPLPLPAIYTLRHSVSSVMPGDIKTKMRPNHIQNNT